MQAKLATTNFRPATKRRRASGQGGNYELWNVRPHEEKEKDREEEEEKDHEEEKKIRPLF